MAKATMVWLRYMLLTCIVMTVSGAGYEVSAENREPLNLIFGVLEGR